MPSRRVLPKLNIFSSKQSASPAPSPPSPKHSSRHSSKLSTSTPMSPPARLHLRNVLPSSPDALPTPPPPPRKPLPWFWQCHSCSKVYRLGCTSRCLDCSHSYCLSANPNSKTVRGRKRRHASGMCGSEFDYVGWIEWGAWRRKVLGIESVGPTGAKQRERAFVNKTHNCWTDCNYPSECHHERYRVAVEAAQNGYRAESPVEEPTSPSFVADTQRSPDDDLPLNEALELKEDEEESKSPTSPKSPLSQTAFFGDEVQTEAEGATEQKKKEEKVWWTDEEGHEKQRKIQSRHKVNKLTGAETSELYQPDSHSANPKAAPEKPRDAKSTSSPQRRNSVSSPSSNSSSSGTTKLTVRNLADQDVWEDWDSDNSDSESDPEDSFLYDSSSRNVSSSESESEDDDGVDDGDEKENQKPEEPLLAPLNVRRDGSVCGGGKDEQQTEDDEQDEEDLAALLQVQGVYHRLRQQMTEEKETRTST